MLLPLPPALFSVLPPALELLLELELVFPEFPEVEGVDGVDDVDGVVEVVDPELPPALELLLEFELLFPELPEVEGVDGVDIVAGEVAPTTTASRTTAFGTGASEARLLVDPVVEVIIPRITGVALVTVVVRVTFLTGKLLATTTGTGLEGVFGAGAAGAGGAVALNV